MMGIVEQNINVAPAFKKQNWNVRRKRKGESALERQEEEDTWP